ncbi:hypothetical protein LWI28_019741 [Acer negundo]|uniref:Serine-threonine/tyrosine-protein kinase catalytic domain-containing protein n=1 Tax=Acer negundo TaxID=4023 RepID=A0AAD5IB19_ACENE|nr:hypothetical protein LWI28_019741 [Acer negundo]KAK4834760.1 hypothetical protein QYF36_000276 [Acer negundo]
MIFQSSDRNGMALFKRAQQAEESYQLQLALALRLSSQAAFADDPNFLDVNRPEQLTASPQAVSHRFWVIGAVGFKGERLEIPNNVNPSVAALIRSCWVEEPGNRPSFSSIMETLQQFLMSSTSHPLLLQT